MMCIRIPKWRPIGGKLEVTSGNKWRYASGKNYSGGPLRFVKRNVISLDHNPHRTLDRALPRRPKRADARRNYDKVVAAAREAFAERGDATSLEEIARRAGVGIGTLYRNFPNRQALLEAVYVDEVESLCRSAAEFEDSPPWDAFSAWMHRLVGYLATKQALAHELLEYLDRDAPLFKTCRESLLSAGEPCSNAPSEPTRFAPTQTSGTSSRWSVGSPRSLAPSRTRSSTSSTIALDGLRYRASPS